MSPEELAVVGIVFGSIVSIVFLVVIGSIIKTWVKRKSGGNLSENPEFLAALREFKEKTDRRLSNLETIVADEHPKQVSSGSKDTQKKRGRDSSIEIEIDEEQDNEGSGEKSNLKNMLNQ